MTQRPRTQHHLHAMHCPNKNRITPEILGTDFNFTNTVTKYLLTSATRDEDHDPLCH